MHEFLQELRQPEYVHVLINHLPLTGLFAALLGLICSLAFGSRGAIYTALVLVALFALSAWPVYVYGLKGYDRVYSMANDTGQAYLQRHKELAQHWTWVYYATAAAAALGIAGSLKWPRMLRTSGILVAILALGSLVAGGVIAECGGKIRHPEFRNGPAPKVQKQSASALVNPADLIGRGARL